MGSEPDAALAAEAMEAFVDDDFERSFELYTRVVEKAPDNASSWIHRSATLLKLSRPTEALADAEKAVTLAPKNPKAHLRKRHGVVRARQETRGSGVLRRGEGTRPHVPAAVAVAREVRSVGSVSRDGGDEFERREFGRRGPDVDGTGWVIGGCYGR